MSGNIEIICPSYKIRRGEGKKTAIEKKRRTNDGPKSKKQKLGRRAPSHERPVY